MSDPSLPHDPYARNTTRRRRRTTRPSQPPAPAVITIAADERERALTAADLASPQIAEDLHAALTDITGMATVVIHDLLAIPEPTRYSIFSTLVDQRSSLTLVVAAGDSQTPVDSLLDVALAAIRRGLSIEQMMHAQRAAVEAIALEYPTAIEIACSRLAASLRAAGVVGVRVTSLARDVRALLGTGAEEQFSAADAARLVLAVAQGRAERHDEHDDSECDDVVDTDDEDDAETTTAMPCILYMRGNYYLYTGTHWRPMADSDLSAWVVEVLQQAGHERMATTRTVGDILLQLAGMTRIETPDSPMPWWVDTDTREAASSSLIACANGLIDIEEAIEGEAMLSRHSPQYVSTCVLPYDYDPDAECPLWLQTLDEIFPLRETGAGREPDRRIDVVQEYMGYCLMSWTTSLEAFLVLVGAGANGKSLIAGVLTDMLGAANVAHLPLDCIGGEFRLPALSGKSANIVADMSRMDRVDEGLLKSLVSGEPINANEKYKTPTTLRSRAKMVFGCNALPPIADRSDGIWRRMIVIPFHRQFAEDERDLERRSQLQEELPGVLNWALIGAQRLIDTGRFSRCGVCDAALAEHRHDSDPIAQYVEECLTLDGAGAVEPTRVYLAYQEWCRANGRKALASAQFGRELHQHWGVQRRRHGGGARSYYYPGVTFTPVGRDYARRARQ